MKAKTVRPQVTAIQDRFFKALNELISQGRIEGGLEGFCKTYGLHKAKYSNLRSALCKGKESAYKFIDLDAPYYLVSDFGVSADWLITGRGEMFKAPLHGRVRDQQYNLSPSLQLNQSGTSLS